VLQINDLDFEIFNFVIRKRGLVINELQSLMKDVLELEKERILQILNPS